MSQTYHSLQHWHPNYLTVSDISVFNIDTHSTSLPQTYISFNIDTHSTLMSQTYQSSTLTPKLPHCLRHISLQHRHPQYLIASNISVFNTDAHSTSLPQTYQSQHRRPQYLTASNISQSSTQTPTVPCWLKHTSQFYNKNKTDPPSPPLSTTLLHLPQTLDLNLNS